MKALSGVLFMIFMCLACSMNTYSIEYPYIAGPERAYQIKTQFIKIQNGMTPSEVKGIMGNPDEIRDRLEPKMKKAKKIGYAYWYLIQRTVEYGSVLEKDEKLVRVAFDLKDRVIKIDHWGFSVEPTIFH